MILKSEDKYSKFFIIIISLILLSLLTAGLFFIFYYKNKDLIIKSSREESVVITPKKENKKNIKPEEVFRKSAISFLFFGDLMIDRHVEEIIAKNGIDYLFEVLAEKEIFQGKDIISANLEGAVIENGNYYSPNNIYDFSFSPETISQLKKYNFNFFNLANNHFYDQGERGIIETRRNLDSLNLNYVGCKDREISDCSMKILEINGQKVGLAGFSMIYGSIDMNKAEEVIRSLKASSSPVIVNIHWGEEYVHQFNKTQENTARKLIDAGADVIIGHHPHVVQGMEIYQNKPIFYSLGNFIFDQYFSADTQEGLAIEINFEDNKMKISLFPIYSVVSQPRIATEKEQKIFFEKFLSWSRVDDLIAAQIKKGEIIINYED